MGAVAALFVVSAFLRGVDIQLLEQMKVDAPHWLSRLHEATGTTPTD